MQPYRFSNFNSLFTKKNIKSYFNGIGKEFFLFSLSTISFQASRFIVAMIVARWVGPVEYGIWNSLQPLIAYGIIFLCGIPNGMNREIPFLMGKRETVKAQKLINFSMFFVLFVSGLIAIITILTSLVLDVPVNLKLPLCFVGILFLPMNMYVLFQFLLKSRIQFQAMSSQQFLISFLYPVITLLCAFFYGISGFILGQALTTSIMVLIIYRIAPFPIQMELSWNHFRQLSRIGMPLMGAGLLYILLTTVDRWVILGYLGVGQLGQYTVAILIFGILSIVPIVISQQMYPRMLYRYAETESFQAIVPMIAKQSLSAFSVTFPLIVVAYFGVPYFVSTFMPQYSQGIIPARILLIGMLFLPLTGGVANFLNTIEKQLYYMLVQAAAVIINFVMATLFVNFGLGLNGVAWAVSISYFLYALILCFTGYIVVTKKIRRKEIIQIQA
jgi:O-antigen/teichoic acid export membrane protein